MPRSPKFIPKKTTDGWRVNIPASVTASRRREQYFFPARDAARDFADHMRQKVRDHGSLAGAISPTMAEDATRAAALLEPWGASLTDAARAFAAAKEAESRSCTVTDAAAAFILSTGHLRDRTVEGYRQVTDKLTAALGTEILATITPEQIAKAAALNCSGAAAANRYRCVRVFWNWCVKKGWCQPEVIAAVEAPKAATDSEIAILSPDAAAALLAVAEKHYPQAVPIYAVQLFAGIRAEEVTKLRAEDVSPTGIELGATVTKKGRRRHITPCKTLAAWLKRHPFKPSPSWPEWHDACRRLAGWDVSARLLDKLVAKGTIAQPKAPTRGRWPQNCLRHSHASYAVAIGTPLEALLFEFGHSGGPGLLRSHYVGKSSKQAALQYFAIRPEGKTAELPQLEPVEDVA